MGFIERVYSKAKKRQSTIILAEAEDLRVLRATAIIEKKNLAKVILLGDEKRIMAKLKRQKIRVKAQILSYEKYQRSEHIAREMVLLRRHKGLILEEAKALLAKDTKSFAAMLVQQKVADGYVAGSLCPTADTLRPALQLIRTEDGFASSYFVMLHKHKKSPLFFADCGLNKAPTSEQLAKIGVQTAKSCQGYKIKPKVAFLSFSTKGSGSGEEVEKVQKAVATAQSLAKEIPIDGELQFDAALLPEIGRRKASGSPVAGKANVFIFPDLNSGNIGYKITERLGGYQAIGPIMQGLKRPVNDLSRGCSVMDIVNVVAITASQVKANSNI